MSSKNKLSFDAFFDRKDDKDVSFVDDYIKKTETTDPDKTVHSSRPSSRPSIRPEPPLADLLADPLADPEKPATSSRPSNRPSSRPGKVSQITAVKNLTDIQAIILCHLLESPDGIYRAKNLAHHTCIKYATIRFSINKLVEIGFITKPVRYKNFGACFSVNDKTLCEAFKLYRLPEIIRIYGHPPSSRPSNRPEPDRSDRRSASLIIEEENLNKSLLPDGLADLLADLCPELYRIGLRKKHLVEIANSWKAMELDTAELPENLERANYDILHKNNIEKPLAYVVCALKKGTYEKPKGFISQEEKARKKAAEQAAQIEKFKKQTEKNHEIEQNKEFHSWWNSLTESEQKSIDDTLNINMNKPGAKLTRKFARMEYYDTHIKNTL